jgi:hypothetical protein
MDSKTVTSDRDKRIKKGTGKNVTKIRLNAHRKRILLPKQTHPGCSSRSFKSYLGAAPPLERGIKRTNSLEAGFDGEHRNSPLERGASSTFFKDLEEAGCVARESAPGLDKMLNLAVFGTGKVKYDRMS